MSTLSHRSTISTLLATCTSPFAAPVLLSVRAEGRRRRYRTTDRRRLVSTSTDTRAFHIDIPEEKLDDLRRRIGATRWPSKELVADRSQGVQLTALQDLCRYWLDEYDWRPTNK